MKTIEIFLDYGCYPMWIFNEQGELVDNDLVEELEADGEIDKMLLEIQKKYDELFEDNAVNFEFKGFKDENDRMKFLRNVESTITLLKEKIGDKYLVDNKVDENSI
ncbi:hypothetical protein [Pontibacillus litoralis]|uniref:Uncharacterized protein n=1 Tax=Pontibacillus litoralis JSM 072002 TaxID=1385512 RepID=A0A0A5G7M6_9BACI|nr:hypothetical protein [Pontibacillus litoralis]KGX88009.1 hypothetical protein N784_13070 [Pontibacillus litoralis JSM 072002]